MKLITDKQLLIISLVEVKIGNINQSDFMLFFVTFQPIRIGAAAASPWQQTTGPQQS